MNIKIEDSTRSWKPLTPFSIEENPIIHVRRELLDDIDETQLNVNQVGGALFGMQRLPELRVIKPAISVEAQAEKDRLEELKTDYDFSILFQKKREPFTHNEEGGEILLGVTNKQGERIDTGKFIKKLEDREDPIFIKSLSLYVMEQVCSRLSFLISDFEIPAEAKVSINVSRRQLDDISIVKRYLDIANKYKIPHNLIQFEITETYNSDDQKMNLIMQLFKTYGFGVAIDDFGKGYNQDLESYKGIPDTIKLDVDIVNRIIEVTVKKDAKDLTHDDMLVKDLYERLIKATKIYGYEIVLEGIKIDDIDPLKLAIIGDLMENYSESKLAKRLKEADRAKNDKDLESIQKKIVILYEGYLVNRDTKVLDDLKVLLEQQREYFVTIRRGKDLSRNLLVQSYDANHGAPAINLEEWLVNNHEIALNIAENIPDFREVKI